jgi:hypothetical protein
MYELTVFLTATSEGQLITPAELGRENLPGLYPMK